MLLKVVVPGGTNTVQLEPEEALIDGAQITHVHVVGSEPDILNRTHRVIQNAHQTDGHDAEVQAFTPRRAIGEHGRYQRQSQVIPTQLALRRPKRGQEPKGRGWKQWPTRPQRADVRRKSRAGRTHAVALREKTQSRCAG